MDYIEISRSLAFQREATERAYRMLLDIAAGRAEPPVPRLMVSPKHGVAKRLTWDERSPRGRLKLVKRFVLEEMARDVRASNRGRAP
jgi:hypothetical protein